MKTLSLLPFLITLSTLAGPDQFGFVDVRLLNPSILVEMRYLTNYNFIGRRINGYKKNICYLKKKAAEKLSLVQRDLQKKNLSLKVYDCYRPQRAVNDFVEWSKKPGDIKMKPAFYSTLDKSRLFQLGYIAKRSSHSKGYAIDLSIVKIPHTPTPFPERLTACQAKNRFSDGSFDMGTDYDCFHENSHTASPKISKEQAKLRKTLKSAMEKHGFKNYRKEWWHYSYPASSGSEIYDFPVE